MDEVQVVRINPLAALIGLVTIVTLCSLGVYHLVNDFVLIDTIIEQCQSTGIATINDDTRLLCNK
jgi:hypothetical protein